MMKEDWIINYLKEYNNIRQLPLRTNEDLIRMLMNITIPTNLSDEYYNNQDIYLQSRKSKKKIVESFLFNSNYNAIYQGDITLLKVDAVVNACNEKLLGCFQPLHGCIDNAIHSYAGLQVRRDLMKVMEQQGFDEPNGHCKVSNAYNLPSDHIFHTVGPKVSNQVSLQDEIDLKQCYITCLNHAKTMNLEIIVFPCISTGFYGFPQKKAAIIAHESILRWKKENQSNIKVIINVFKDSDLKIYNNIVGG
jgi:O-acetyl-ADP-ribose deacetylase (regulator of RNase III)